MIETESQKKVLQYLSLSIFSYTTKWSSVGSRFTVVLGFNLC